MSSHTTSRVTLHTVRASHNLEFINDSLSSFACKVSFVVEEKTRGERVMFGGACTMLFYKEDLRYHGMSRRGSRKGMLSTSLYLPLQHITPGQKKCNWTTPS